VFKRAAVLAVLGSLLAVRGFSAEAWPAKNWERISDPASVGYSRAGLRRALDITRDGKTSAMLVVVGGRVLLE